MVQLKITPQTSPFRPGQSTPQQFGAGVGKAVGEVGQQVQAAGRIADGISKARARSTAARFDAALGLEEERIKSDLSSMDTWEDQFDAAKASLAETFGDETFIHKGTFNQQAGLRADQRKVGLASHKNRLMVQSGVAAMDENLNTSMEAFALTDDPGEQALHLAEMVNEVSEAAANGLIFEEQIPAKVRSAQTNGVLAAYERLLNVNPLRAGVLAEQYTEIIGTKAAQSLKRKAWVRYQSDMNDSVTSSNAANIKRDRLMKEGQRAQRTRIIHIAGDPDGAGLTIGELRVLKSKNPRALDSEGWAYAYKIAAEGGRLASKTNSSVNIRLMRIANGTEELLPEEGSLQDLIDAHQLRGELTQDRGDKIIKQSKERRFSSVLRNADKVVEALALGGVRAALAGAEFQRDAYDYVADNPDAEREDVQAHVEELYKFYDPYKIRQKINVSFPKFYKFDASGNVDVASSIPALREIRQNSLLGTGKYEPGSRFHMGDAAFQAELEALNAIGDDQKRVADLRGKAAADKAKAESGG